MTAERYHKHGPSSDPYDVEQRELKARRAILDAHDNGDHSMCDPRCCDNMEQRCPHGELIAGCPDTYPDDREPVR